ncbi:DUF1553 domain-containing protein [soil metagenome]
MLRTCQRSRQLQYLVSFLSIIVLGVSTVIARAGDKIEYNRDIRPILAENCFSCHGPDSASRKASLRLDQRQAAIDTGAIVPQKPDESELVTRVCSGDIKSVMPPAKSNKKLTARQKQLLRDWIAAGANYQPHWSLIAPVRPTLPAVKAAAWSRNGIDAFVLSNLEQMGLQPASEADRRTLARRVSLDLTGLPPAPERVEAFVKDPSPTAYEDLVDEFLRSPHYGEHRGRYWLDAARFADTHGIHIDNYREIWAYRDWVISAFNRNLPFDRFTIEQLAGDLLPNHTLDQQVASGFNRCNITTSEGGAINEEYLVLYTRDRTETTSQVWLGLTAGCAVCHDHKFDPISQREFYQMAAFFNNTTQAAMDGNVKDTPPIVVVPKPEELARWQAIEAEAKQTDKELQARKTGARTTFETWMQKSAVSSLGAKVPTRSLKLHLPLNEDTGKMVSVLADGQKVSATVKGETTWADGHISTKSYKAKPGATLELPTAGNFERNQAFSYGAWIYLPKKNLTGSAIARMDDKNAFRGWDIWIEGGKPATHIVHKWPDNALKVVSNNKLKEAAWNHVFVSYDGSSKAAGVQIYVNGVRQETTKAADTLRDSIRAEVPFTVAQRARTDHIDNLQIQDIRLYDRALTNREVADLAGSQRASFLASKPKEKRTATEANELFDFWLTSEDAVFRSLTERQRVLAKEKSDIKSRGTIAHVMNEKGEAAQAFTLFRGDYDKRRDQVSPQTPAALPSMPKDLPRNRLGFAKWLLSAEHPLTARVTVNRLWQEFFGTGLVRTAGDFGITGEAPSHPELLDWLAVEFRESGWDMKRLVKLIVMSSTYRQAATTDAKKLELDNQNRYLSRGPRFRMDAEMIRDYALAASGLLVEKIGGPSVKPYQPDGVWEAVAMIGSDTRDYRRDKGDKLYRRSLYTFWKRSAPPASMDVFNAPSRENCTVRRERTDTPLQALVTLNDPQFVEAARQLAARVYREGGTKPAGRIEALTKRTLLRPPSLQEAVLLSQSLQELVAYYQAHPEDAKKLISVGDSPVDDKIPATELAAWTMLCNQVLNLDEVLNK